MANKNEKQSEKIKKKSKAPWIVLTVVVAAAAVYLGIGAYFNTHFCFGTTINGVNISGADLSGAKEAIAAAVDNYSLDIELNGAVKDTIIGGSAGVKAAVDSGEIEEFLAGQNGFLWPSKFLTPDELYGVKLVTYDYDSLLRRVSTLSCVKKPATRKTVNATCELEGDTFVVKEEIRGNEVDPGDLCDKLGDYILRLKPSVDLERDNLYLEPQITKDSPELLASVDLLNQTADMTINYDVGEVVDRRVISKWISLDEYNNIVYNEGGINDYVKSLGEKYNTVGKPKTLKTSFGNTVTVPGGNYGWQIDTDKETELLISDLKAGVDVSRDFEYKIKAASHGENDYGDSYVEVNISAQKLFFYVDGKLVIESPFVSGNLARGMGTHLGAYRIAYCERNAILRGQGYASPVSFWMPFNMGEGLHDATWRGAFGGNIYRTSGSHGCVNLPYNTAKTIFEKVSAGFPVLVYADDGYNPGTPVAVKAEVTPGAVMEQISAIGVVTLDKEAAITSARKAYNALSNEDKAKVTNIDSLLNAETHLSVLKGQTEPAEPDAPDTPDTPDAPDTPDTPDTPDVPDTPDTPDAPDTPDVPEQPEESNDTDNNSQGEGE